MKVSRDVLGYDEPVINGGPVSAELLSTALGSRLGVED